MKLRDLLLMEDSIERTRVIEKYQITMKKPNYANKVPEKFQDEDSKTKKIKGDPINKGKLESTIEREIVYWLESHRVCYWHMKVKGEIHMTGNGQGVIKKSANKGFPDILCCIDGTFVGLEVKKCGGIQSKHQTLAEEKIAAAGGYYFIVTSTRDLEIQLKLKNLMKL